MQQNDSLRAVPIGRTRSIPRPSTYVNALLNELSAWAYDEERAVQLKGKWRKGAFGEEDSFPLDLELGTGNGFFFAHQAHRFPDRGLVGVEKKFKPLIQSIKRARSQDAENARMVRYNAHFVKDLFAANEIDNVYIHFPDPWLKKKWKKNRLIQDSFLEDLLSLQKPGGFVEFKTDSRDYFDHALECFERSDYICQGFTYDLHNSQWANENFVTHFENIFLKKKLPIHYLRYTSPFSN